MKKEKFIRFRVPESFHDSINEKAQEHGMTVSGYSRSVLKESVNRLKDPFKSDDFLHLVQWTYTVRGSSNPEAYIYDVKHYMKIIMDYYPLLDFKLQNLFDNLIDDLRRIISDYNVLVVHWGSSNSKFVYSFGDKNHKLFLDYELLEEYFDLNTLKITIELP